MISKHQNPFTVQTVSSAGDSIVDECVGIIAELYWKLSEKGQCPRRQNEHEKHFSDKFVWWKLPFSCRIMMAQTRRWSVWWKREWLYLARRLLFDYYRKKPRKSCPVRLPRFFFRMAEICVTPTKPLPCRAFRLDGLITPTTISYPKDNIKIRDIICRKLKL